MNAMNEELNGTMEQMGTEFEEMNEAMKGFDGSEPNLIFNTISGNFSKSPS